MPIKSWAFIHEGHPVRCEIWWRFTGWNRKRLYVDHQFARSGRGRFTAGRPVSEKPKPGTESPITIRFRSRRMHTDMDCQIQSSNGEFVSVTSAHVDRKWFASEEDGAETSRLQMNLNFLCIIPFLIMMMFLYGPLVMIVGAIHSIQEKRLRRRMKATGRYLSWPQIEQRMTGLTSPCTLMIQVANLTPWRAWWTTEDVAGRSPLPLPEHVWLMHPACSTSWHPFSEWCAHHYLSEPAGKAFLTDLPSNLLEDFGPFEDAEAVGLLRSKYPHLNLVYSGYTRQRNNNASEKFAELLGDNLPASLPRILAASMDGDRELRRMCYRSVELAGEQAAFAVPQLKERFFLGPAEDRYLIAGILRQLGPDGITVLKQAITIGDPRISRSAKTGVAMAERAEKRVATIPRKADLVTAEERARRRRKS